MEQSQIVEMSTEEHSTASSGTKEASSSASSDESSLDIPLPQSSEWGPTETHSGYIEYFYIKDNIGIGFIAYDTGKSTEGTYLYAIDIFMGDLIGKNMFNMIVFWRF